MQAQRLGSRQLFTMIGGNLEKRIIKFFNETKDVSTVIEYAVAVLVRRALVSNFVELSFMCRELIRELFLTAASNNTLRRFSVFFENYFTIEEWKSVVARLYANEADYRAATEEARLYKDYLKEKDPTRTDKFADHQFILKSIFKGANGRKHTWTLKNAHPTKKQEEIVGALKILTMLTIFETNGVRKFTEYIDSSKDAIAPDPDFAEEKEAQTADEPAKKTPSKPKSGKKASGKKTEKQPKNTSIGNSEDIKDIPVRDLSNEPLADQSISSGRDPNATEQPATEQPSGTLETPPDSTKEKDPPDDQHASAKKQKKAGKQETNQTSGKSKEQRDKEKDERKLRNQIAKYFKKRGKK